MEQQEKVGEKQLFGREIHLQRFVLSKNSRDLLESFSCGNAAIDCFFREQAAFDEARVTYVFINEDNGDIVACVTIECSAIYFQRKGESLFSDFLSAMEIDYFALSEKYRHIKMSKGSKFTLGDIIMRNVLMMLKDISRTTIGAATVVLYSVPDAVTFYRRNNFFFFEEGMTADSWKYVEGCIPMHYDLNT